MVTRILIVDDASFIRDLIKRNIRQKFPGVETVEATDGRRAQALLQQSMARNEIFDLILSDWEMPGLTGEELLAWVREQDAYAKTPFVMITSRGDKEHVAKAIQAGVNDYLSKPFSPDELFKKIFKQLKRLNKLPAPPKPGQASSNALLDSASILAGAGAKPAAAKQAPAAVSNPLLTASVAKKAGKPVAKKAAAAKQPKVKGIAQLRFGTEKVECEVHELSLKGMSGSMPRPETCPALFDQAAVDIGLKGDVQSINAYFHSLESGAPSPESTSIKLSVRFVDDDPSKMMALSKMIASGTGIQFTG